MTVEELREKSLSAEFNTIVFDLFHVLVVYPSYDENDFFRLVGKKANISNFKQYVAAAKKILVKSLGQDAACIPHSAIYAEIESVFPLAHDTADMLGQIEEELYLDITKARRSIRSIYDAVSESGKDIVIVVNQAIETELAARILHANGFHKWKKLLSLVEVRTEGGQVLLPIFRADSDPHGKTLYLSNFEQHDLANGDMSGVKYYKISSPIELLKNVRKLGEYYNNLGKRNDNKYLIAFSAIEMFDDPFIQYSSDCYLNNNLDNFSNYIFGPYILAFTKWMLDDCEKEDIEKICYIYRDGYLIEKVHKILAGFYKDFLVEKAYITRSLTNLFRSKQKNGLNESICDFLTNNQMTRDDFLKRRLFIEAGSGDYSEAIEIFREHGVYRAETKIPRERYFDYAFRFEKFFHKNAKRRLEVAESYINSIFGDGKKTAVFDVGYRGSACRLLKDQFHIETTGYHFLGKEMVKNENCHGLKVKAPIFIGLSDEQKTTIIQILTEDLLNSQEKSVVSIKKDTNGNFVFEREMQAAYSDIIESIQNKCIKYAEDFSRTFHSVFRSLDLDILPIYEFYRRFLERASVNDAALFKNISFADSEFMNPNKPNPYRQAYDRIAGKKSVAPYVRADAQYSEFRIKTYFWLKDHGILGPCRFVWRLGARIKNKILNLLFYEKQVVLQSPSEKILKDFDQSISTIRRQIQYRCRPTVLFFGHNAAFDKGTCSYINHVAENTNYDYLFVSEAPHISRQVLEEKIFIDYKVVQYVPMNNCYHKNIDMPVDKELSDWIKSKNYIKETVESIRKRFPDMGKNYPDHLTRYLYHFYEELLDTYSVGGKGIAVIAWNEFTSMHYLLKNICQEKNIPILYFEFGVLPGTLCLETRGQMGESDVAVNDTQFMNLVVSDNQIQNATKLIQHLKENGLNRNPQPVNDEVSKLKKYIDNGRPTVVYFGQNDYESGIYPYTKISKSYHSPIFKSSDEAAIVLEKVCKKQGYNFIYKPHPTIYAMYGAPKGFSKETIIVDKVNLDELIDLSTVTVTILSQTAYVSLIRGKPVIMLGYNQLRGKACTYECFDEKDLEKTLMDAVHHGLTSEQKSAFIRHVAQLNRYYLFDDEQKTGESWGLPITAFEGKINAALKDSREMSSKAGSSERNSMKIAIIASMPANSYSGGRSHAWNLAESLSYTGNKVYFISQNKPIFQDAIRTAGISNEIIYIETKDFIVDLPEEQTLDYVVIAPHRDRNETFYLRARAFAIKMNAKLVLINYESGNWVNQYLHDEIPLDFWEPWKNVCNDGCMILSSNRVSMEYAKEFYTTNLPYTVFDYWYPTINSVSADATPDVPKENQIIAMIRLSDSYKGSYDILEILDEQFKDYKIVLLYGSGVIDAKFRDYQRLLEEIKERYGVNYEIKIQVSDLEKFSEIKKSKFLLFPSYFEGHGTPPIEAQYCNTICFAYDLPVLRETAGSGIVFCKYGDPADMKEKLLTYMHQDCKFEGLKESVEQYAKFESCAQRLEHVFRAHLHEDWRNPDAKAIL